jgi:NADPH2:quinone reductase
MRELGVDQFIDYTNLAADEVVRDADLVVDAVGGRDMERFLRVLKPGGALFLVNPLGFAGHEQAHAQGIVVSSTQVRSNGTQLAQGGRLLEDGTVRLKLDSSYSLADAWRAHECAMQGRIQGKIVLTVRGA